MQVRLCQGVLLFAVVVDEMAVIVSDGGLSSLLNGIAVALPASLWQTNTYRLLFLADCLLAYPLFSFLVHLFSPCEIPAAAAVPRIPSSLAPFAAENHGLVRSLPWALFMPVILELPGERD
jgi:hypothetical protein